ncbi:hypothetical protein [Rhizobium leguminosarum]|uniref:hypothetical protein n=1 Tax=Rhizobium leguminosarum TaxID=384 RepID=UPI002E118208|nr:hypothetical protein U8Q02_43175 [Rhizobium leguminosarum]
MNFTNEARLGGALLVAIGAVFIFVVLCVAGMFYKPATRDEAARRWIASCIDENRAYGCFEKIVRERDTSEESKKARLSALGNQIGPGVFLETCTLASKVECAFHIVDFGVVSWAAFNSYAGKWEDFDKRVEQGSHCKRLTCLSDRVPLPDVNWDPV